VHPVDISAADVSTGFFGRPSPPVLRLPLPTGSAEEMTSPTVLRTRVVQPERTLSSPATKLARLDSIFGNDFINKYDLSHYGKARRRRRTCSYPDYLPGSKRTDGNLVTRLQDRTHALHPKIHHAAHIAMNDPMRFHKFNLEHLMDVNVLALSPEEVSFAPRTKIVEIVGADDVVFCLTQSGVCLTFERESMNFLCKINSDNEEVIRSLFLNRKNDSLIIVSVHREDNFSSLKCKSIQMK
jgi:hypothetical protein